MVFSVLYRVFSSIRYVQLAAVAAFIVLSAAILLPNTKVILQVLGSTGITFLAKCSFIFSLYGSILSNFTWYSALFTIGTAFLFGANIALLTYYVRRRQVGAAAQKKTTHVAHIGGIVSGILGVGCAACGSVIISAALATFGAGGLLLLLPLHGAEFGLLGVLLLCVTLYQLTQRINDPLVCGV